MRKEMKLIAAAILLALVGCSPQQFDKDQPVRIGIPAPLSGGSAEYGEFMRQGATLAADEINARGGISGKRLELEFEDSQGQPAEAVNAAEKLITRDRVNVVTCAFNSSATLAVAEVAKREGVPLVVGLSTADGITGPAHPIVFRVCAPNTTLAELLGDYIAQLERPSTIAYVFEKTDFGTNLADVVRRRLENAGIKTTNSEGVNQHETDFLSLITKLKASRPDMVFLAVLADSALPFLRQAQQAGFHSKWANAVSLSSPKFLEEAGKSASGFIGITHFDAATAEGQARSFVEHFRSKYGQAPTHYSAVYYDTINLIAVALTRGGIAPEKLSEALKTTDFAGITGRIRFDQNGQAHIGTIIFRWENGKMTIIKTNPGS